MAKYGKCPKCNHPYSGYEMKCKKCGRKRTVEFILTIIVIAILTWWLMFSKDSVNTSTNTNQNHNNNAHYDFVACEKPLFYVEIRKAMDSYASAESARNFVEQMIQTQKCFFVSSDSNIMRIGSFHQDIQGKYKLGAFVLKHFPNDTFFTDAELIKQYPEYTQYLKSQRNK